MRSLREKIYFYTIMALCSLGFIINVVYLLFFNAQTPVLETKKEKKQEICLVPCYSYSYVQNQDNLYSLGFEDNMNKIIEIWHHKLKEEGIKETDSRFDLAYIYAETLTQAIYHYQTIGENGQRLPLDNSVFTFFAEQIFYESKLDSHKIGESRKEVGLGQLHGAALNGFSKKEAQKFKLNIYLSVRWITLLIAECPKTKKINNWKESDWVYPLSIYIYGSKGRCKALPLAKQRVNKK